MDKLENVIKKIPQSKFEDIFPLLKEFIRKSNRCIIVLDDDPTGCQTMYGIPVLFQWDREYPGKGIAKRNPPVFPDDQFPEHDRG